ncbi:MAG TPA: hypothetical protein VJU53_15200 [Burkholderiaceae bacterium]|nr:hypothetical protein [Burkholderiaceae bacterium]
MVAEQMICIITPPQQLSLPKVQVALQGFDALFKRVGRVHFASIAVLPGCSGEPRLPSLMLELVVDDALGPEQLITLLVQDGFEKLWEVYGTFWNGGSAASELVRRDWLHGFLMWHVNRASGGFVGARDRNVAQILSEAQLFEAARSELHQCYSGQVVDRASLARAISDWAAGKGEYRWAAEPAPRSFWRSSRVTPMLRPILALGLLVLPLMWAALTVLAIVAGIGIAALGSLLMFVPLDTILQSRAIFGTSYPYAIEAIATVSAAVLFIAAVAVVGILGIRSVSVAAFMLLFLGMLLLLALVAAAVVSFFYVELPQFLGFVTALEVLVRAGVLTLLAATTAWAVVAAAFFAALLISRPFMGLSAVLGVAVALTLLLALVAHWILGALVAHGASMHFGVYPELSQGALLGLPAIDAIALIVLVVLAVATYQLVTRGRVPPFVKQNLAGYMDKLNDYDAAELPAAHQVHPSIDECEARLARDGRPAHLLSLTDVRRPYFINRLMLRFFLWLVTYIGHTIFVNGRLANADGIRFAHWHLIDDGRRFLFCSNYDGSFGGYLDEFITGTSEGINLFWRWTELRQRPAAIEGHPEVTYARRYPPTRLGIFQGCKYEQWFKTYARDSSLPHIYRFEAYRYSAQDVARATRLRESLFGVRSVVKDDRMMRALES